jgi:hypothetical protein
MDENHWTARYITELTRAIFIRGFVPNPDAYNLRRFDGAIFRFNLNNLKPHEGYDFSCRCLADACSGEIKIHSVVGMVGGMKERADPFVILHECPYALFMTHPANKWELLRITRQKYEEYGRDKGWWD